MEKLSLPGVVTVCALHLAGCGATSTVPPPVTSEMAKIHAPGSKGVATLHQGRTLFVSRCIECHTLPAYWHYSNEEWPRLIDTMAHRSHLKSAERDAILAYIRAARAKAR